MVVLEKPAFGTTTRRSDKCALSAITVRDFTLHVCGDIPTASSPSLYARHARAINGRVLRLLQFPNQQRERAVDNCGDVAIWNAVSEEILSSP